MSGFHRRAFSTVASGAKPSAQDFLRTRAQVHAALPAGALAAQHYVVFDLESTGLDPTGGDATLSIGAVRLRNAAPVARFSTLVDPCRAIPAESIRFHGITEAMARGQPRAAEAIAGFLDFIGDDVLVAHNAAFDRTLLLMEEYRGAPAVRNPILCSVALSRWLDPDEPDHSLDGLCGRAGILIAGRHQALGDAEATASLWAHLLARAAARGVDDLQDLAQRSRMQISMSALAGDGIGP
ncbi:3'-5' exonuclease [Roseomonas sp. PWR1]|uniref:DNA-directed DNA polymerase n=1 Tax=Roseomonas nitratireducens TaxID=2820810 RepID=A0ABS4AVI7_9PROT|nr:3'-5' exonuclease [Neoroseomonas nitratireducens]MBP0465351.1 3'-5' exonuclease [Neoroseomonas nitratireducens]